MGCSKADIDSKVDVTVSEAMPTVATVEWDLATPGVTAAFVEFGREGPQGNQSRALIDSQGRARAVLAGMKPSSKYLYRVVEVVQGNHLYSSQYELHTGPLDVAVLPPTLDVRDAARASRGYVVTSIFADRSVAVILDSDGEVVWAHRPKLAWDNVHISRVANSRVGDWIAYHAKEGQLEDVSVVTENQVIVRVSLDGTREEYIPVPYTHHDFVEIGDGNFVVLRSQRRTLNGAVYDADDLVEIQPDGTERTVWSAWDHFDFTAETTAGPDGSFTHANAVDYDRIENAYYVSLRNINCIVKVDRDSGGLVWKLGGDHSDFALPDGGTELFWHQHEFELLDDDIIVFDNQRPEGGDSRVVRYALDPGAGTASVVWEHHADPRWHCPCLGDVHALPNSNTLVTWSAQGRIDEVTPEGELVWSLRAGGGKRFGYAIWRQTLSGRGRPAASAGTLDQPDSQSTVGGERR